jgi:dolichol kinase
MRVIKQMLQGNDNKYSLRRVLALFFSAGICFHVTYCTFKNQPMNDGAIASMAALVAALLSLTTWQNSKNDNSTNTTI